MAAGVSRSEPKLTLEIRTKSVEQTLVPLVTQITTLVNAKEKPIRSERTLAALVRVGQAVNLAVERFVVVGEAIARDNPEIQREMCDACRDAKLAGSRIEALTDVKLDDPGTVRSLAEKTAMVRAARQLLSAITKVLILADRVVIKQLIVAKDKVLSSLLSIESCVSFADFVRVFSQFGNDMVQLAHLSGDRQNDLKSDRSRTQMIAARAVLEKSTMMLLSSTKTVLRHPECDSARATRDNVIAQMKRALDVIQVVVTDGGGPGAAAIDSNNQTCSSRDISPLSINAADSGIGLSHHQTIAFKAIKDFEDAVELVRVTLIAPDTETRLVASLEVLLETTQDFTDSAYTTHDHRQQILMISEQLRHQLAVLLRAGTTNTDDKSSSAGCSQELEMAILKLRETLRSFKKQLIETAMDQAADVFKLNEDQQLLAALKASGMSGQRDRVNELTVKFDEHAEQLQEVCKLLRHVASVEPLVIWCDHVENMLKCLSSEMLQAAVTLACFPTSKMCAENVDVFANAWSSQINDLSVLVKDVNDACHGKSDKQVYLSLPRPGVSCLMILRARSLALVLQLLSFRVTLKKHGLTARGVKPAQLTGEEQAKIAKAGLEMKLITSEMDAEAEKWQQRDNEIVRRAKNMSSMAFSMYLFTRGEGPLHTTQDLFIQAEYFAEEGTKLFHAVKHFALQVPAGSHRNELVLYMDRLPIFCQQINQTIRAQTVGKAATFNKVDKVIQETKNLMNAVAKVVTVCFVCSSKYTIEYTGQLGSLRPMQSNFHNGGSELDPGAKMLRSEPLQQPFRRSSSLTSKPHTDRM